MIMKLLRYSNAGDFIARTGRFLESREAENNLILGIAGRLPALFETSGPSPYLATIEHDERGDIAGACIRTALNRAVLTRMPERGIEMIVDDLADIGVEYPGFVGPAREAKLAAGLWRERTGGTFRLTMEMRIYELDRVIPPARMDGALRAATDDDIDIAVTFATAFVAEVGLVSPVMTIEEIVKGYIRERRLYLWDLNGKPVSMAGCIGPTPNGIRINYVYTPPELRGNGYASQCVAALSQHLLDSGRRFCFLFTDLANPVSNSIYQRMGYRPVADFSEYELAWPVPGVPADC
ncbi:MAG: family N-acetyltransferase [Chlorobi bacterium]|nr:family N-acetyltransferase [Chlorobiota bacterium]